jgi:hypothetical protein
LSLLQPRSYMIGQRTTLRRSHYVLLNFFLGADGPKQWTYGRLDVWYAVIFRLLSHIFTKPCRYLLYSRRLTSFRARSVPIISATSDLVLIPTPKVSRSTICFFR